MILNIPQQTQPAASATPSHPRKLKKKIAALPNSNMGELTRQTFAILRDLNRQTMPSKHRLEDMEMLRPLAREIFNNLQKYFVNRTLPLPEKSQKIVNLNQSILQELVYGYAIIASEAANNTDQKVDNKTLTIAICRAINYLSEILLRASEVYTLSPEHLWSDVHQLYDFAESRGIADKTVIDNEKTPEKITIANSYKQILLFNLSRPIALRQRDSNRVYNELFEWVKLCTLHNKVTEEMIDRVFCMHINEDRPPHYLNRTDLESGDSIRVLNASKLVIHIKELQAERKKEKQKLALGDEIPLETLNALVFSWGVNAKRRFSRADRNEHIYVAIGLKKIARAINDSYKDDTGIDTKSGFVRTSTSTMQDPDFTLESISYEENSGLQGYVTHTEIGAGENNNWDLVARGRALTDTYEKQQNMLNQGPMANTRKNIDDHWQIVNVSAGGYCLRWNSDEPSKAQIGELIALQEFSSNKDFEWRIGVIRWMQYTDEHGLEIGVQVISPKVITASAQRVNRPNEIPFDCLMLPGVKAIKQAPSIILPSHAFKTGDKLNIQALNSKIGITLIDTREHTGSFTQFTYSNSEEVKRVKKQVKKEEANKNKDDFDELWSSL